MTEGSTWLGCGCYLCPNHSSLLHNYATEGGRKGGLSKTEGGRKGGLSKSEKKQKAARENGKKGGRPKRKVNA